jgi:hypothetical protein
MNTANMFKILQKIVLLFSMMLGCFFQSGCGGGGGGGSTDKSNTDTVNPQALYFEKAIDETGGVLEITDLDSRAFGAKTIVLPGALTEEKIISLTTGVTSFETPANYIPAGEQINFGPDGTLFEKKIFISIPYFDIDNDGFIDGTTIPEDNVLLFYFNEQIWEWEKVEMLNRNYADNIVEAETDHFSTYLVAVDENGEEVNDVDEAAEFRTGEYFVGPPELTIIDPEGDINAFDNTELVPVGCIGQDISLCSKTRTCVKCGTPYVLTVSIRDTLTTVIDRYATRNGGIPVIMDEAGESVTFDPTEIFEKVGKSGDANLWTWRCDFIPEHTHLQKYRVCSTSTNDAICTENDEQFFSSIEVINANTVRINFGIDVSDESNIKGEALPNINFASGDMIAIEFEANYL